jgi:hypothetical protein
MDTVLPACITGGLGLLSGLLVGYKDEIKGLLARTTRRVAGTWAGKAHDVQIPGLLHYEHPLQYEVTCHIKQRGRRVTGHFVAISDRTSHITIKGRLQGDYIIGEYRNDDNTTTDEGVAVIQFLGTGRDLRGFFIGRRIRDQGIAVGHVAMKKQ